MSIPNPYQTNSLKSDTETVSFDRYMEDSEKPRSIRFPQGLWDRIDAEARRCKRSAVKQMEAVLSAYYDMDGVELNSDKLNQMQGKSELGLIARGITEARKERIAAHTYAK